MTALSPQLQQKWDKLLTILNEKDDILIALSGGVDSALLALAATHSTCTAAAVTIDHEMIARREIQAACKLADELSLPHIVLEIELLHNIQIAKNNHSRCYYCKQAMLEAIQSYAEKIGFSLIADGKNADDAQNFRPGDRACIEADILQPLAMVGLKKQEIRELAAYFALSCHNKPSTPCLATRIPYDTALEHDLLKNIEQGEEWLCEQGFTECRLRIHGKLCRLEIPPQDFLKLQGHESLINEKLKELRFDFVTVDLGGIQHGCFDK